MRFRKLAVAATSVLAAGAGVVAPAPASAAATCPKNVVCLYDADRTFTLQYSEYTSFYQRISRSGVESAWNRTPATVYFRYENGGGSCMIAGAYANLTAGQFADSGAVIGIRLSSRRSCN